MSNTLICVSCGWAKWNGIKQGVVVIISITHIYTTYKCEILEKNTQLFTCFPLKVCCIKFLNLCELIWSIWCDGMMQVLTVIKSIQQISSKHAYVNTLKEDIFIYMFYSTLCCVKYINLCELMLSINKVLRWKFWPLSRVHRYKNRNVNTLKGKRIM